MANALHTAKTTKCITLSLIGSYLGEIHKPYFHFSQALIFNENTMNIIFMDMFLF